MIAELVGEQEVHEVKARVAYIWGYNYSTISGNLVISLVPFSGMTHNIVLWGWAFGIPAPV